MCYITKISCFNTQDNYETFWTKHGGELKAVAKGLVDYTATKCHGITLSPDIVRVEVREALVGFAPLPVVTAEFELVGQALKSMVPWPRNLIGQTRPEYPSDVSSVGEGGDGRDDGGDDVSGPGYGGGSGSGVVGAPHAGGGDARDGLDVDESFLPDGDHFDNLRVARQALFRDKDTMYILYIEKEVMGELDMNVFTREDVDDFMDPKAYASQMFIALAMS